MANIQRFEDIDAWKTARELTRVIYEVSSIGEFARDFTLRGQIRRAGISVMGNIAEGFERGGDGEFKQFLSVAKGSAGEVKSHLYVALDAKFVSQSQFDWMYSTADQASRILGGFISYLKQSDLRGHKFDHDK